MIYSLDKNENCGRSLYHNSSLVSIQRRKTLSSPISIQNSPHLFYKDEPYDQKKDMILGTVSKSL